MNPLVKRSHMVPDSKQSDSFTCHPLMNHTCFYSPATEQMKSIDESPLTSNRHHLSYDDCLENKGRLQDCSCSIGSYHCIQCYAHIL